MKYDAVIIGAGVGGLFCALKLAKEGKKILLLEGQPIPGGYATTFKRKGFTFESSVHCVDALQPEGEIRKFLEEAGIASRLEFIDLPVFARIIFPGNDYLVHTDHEILLRYLKGRFPHEGKNISRLFYFIAEFSRQFDHFNEAKIPLWLKLILSPVIYPTILKVINKTAEEFISKFVSDKELKAVITDIWRFTGLPPSRMSAFYFLIVFKGYYYNRTAYIKGGTCRIFEEIIKEIRALGAEVCFNATAKKIIIDQDNKVSSVITEDGREYQAKAVISNADAIETLTAMVENKAIKEKYLKEMPFLEKSISAVQVYLGLKVPAKNLGMRHYLVSLNTNYDHEKNFSDCLSGDYDNCSLELVDHAQLDSGLAPPGKGMLLIMTLDSYANWKDLDDNQYQARKQEAADKFIKRTEKYLPGLSGNIEVMEIATPRTMKRYASSSEGAIYGFAQTVEQSGLNRFSQETDVKGLFLAGAWTFPGGGVHGCFVSGIEAAELALKYLRKTK